MTVTTQDTFVHALGDTLAPAGMTLSPLRDVVPPALVDIAEASRELADREHASATVWLLFSGAGATLVAYDRGVDRVLVRELPFVEPLGEAQAAEAARMARTMLRALRVTPDTDSLPPRASEAPAIRERAAARETAVLAPPRPSPGRWLGLELDGGLHVDDALRASFAVTMLWRPDAPGLAATLRLATRRDVLAAELDGALDDGSLALLARYPIQIGPVELAPAGGCALHVVRLSGDIAGMQVADTRLDPALRVGATASIRMGGRLTAGVGVWGDWLLRRQSYDVGALTAFTIPATQLTAGAVVGARFP